METKLGSTITGLLALSRSVQFRMSARHYSECCRPLRPVTDNLVYQDLAAGSLRLGPEKRRMRELGVQIFSTRRTLDERQITFFADRIRHGHSVSGNRTEA